ncbi:FHA domain-containing protein [Planctomicrobium piriforme]|uniref:FHA domain-containing protein n=1 Tax=Planctomicrobium piriforme TaxID=1576369 RepID=A0A1I3F7T1_9PLAN|nr:hypothetical protein [Planctomicrobium piriforme]SFI07274.1 hypothetical protein SAMN05421753_105118 [Planctomicrobium piriforme]
MSADGAIISLTKTPGCRAWIDGVGCWLIWFQEELMIGNAAGESSDFRLRFPAHLRTRHAVVQRTESGDWLNMIGECRVNDSPVLLRQPLFPKDRIQLGEELKLSWNRPNPLSGTAVLSFENQRTADHLDGAVLFQETCLIGAGKQTHIRCRHWEQACILFARGGELWRRTQDSQEIGPVVAGEPFSVGQWRMRIETLTDLR